MVERDIGKIKDILEKFETIKYVDISSIDNKSKKIYEVDDLSIKNAPSRAQQLIKKGDILISTVRPNLQNMAINPFSEENVIASTGFCVLRCVKCLPKYLWGAVCTDAFTLAMCERARGVSYPAVRDSDILNYLIPLPQIEEQENYVHFVKQLDKSKYADSWSEEQAVA